MKVPMACGAQGHQVVRIMGSPLYLGNDVMDLQESGVGATGPLAAMPVPLQDLTPDRRGDGRAAALARLMDDGVFLQARQLRGRKGNRPALGLDFRLLEGRALVHVDLDGWA
jgi:hypothetical protein